MAIFMHNKISPQLVPVPANQTLVLSNGTAITNLSGISIWNSEPSQAQRDFSTQVLTTISTLVVALAGFYFGTKSVEQAQKPAIPAEARLTFNPPSSKRLKDVQNQIKEKDEERKTLSESKNKPADELK
jgi:hypothetical protein